MIRDPHELRAVQNMDSTRVFLSLSLKKGKKKENTAVDTHFFFTFCVQFLARDPGVDTSRMGESIPAHDELMI